MKDVANSRSESRAGRSQNWVFVLALFCFTSVVEAYGVSQVFAFMLPYLLHLGLPKAEAQTWVGALFSLTFVLGLPLVPLWGVWADKYSRKAVIVRSALVEAVVFTLVGLSTTPWEIAGAMLLIGFQLGNTGVMLAALRELVPVGRLGFSISLFGAMGPIGLAVGPVVSGFLLSNLHTEYSQIYYLAAALSVLVAILLTWGFREVRPEIIPEGTVLRLAYGVIQKVLQVQATRKVFLAFGLGFFGYQAAFTYLSLLVIQIYGQRPGLEGAIGWVVGGSQLLGALVSPFGGLLGDRFGFRRVLVVATAGAALSLAIIPFTGTLALLLAVAVVFGACVSAFSAMVFSLLALETPPERRSSTLNLVYLPLYVAGIVAPLVAGGVLGLTGNVAYVFLLAALLFAGSLLPLLRGAGTETAGPVEALAPDVE